jgi:hypothetical protein
MDKLARKLLGWPANFDPEEGSEARLQYFQKLISLYGSLIGSWKSATMAYVISQFDQDDPFLLASYAKKQDMAERTFKTPKENMKQDRDNGILSQSAYNHLSVLNFERKQHLYLEDTETRSLQ